MKTHTRSNQNRNRRTTFRLSGLSAVCSIVICFAAATGAEQKLTPEQQQFFESKVRPLLAEHCYKCHGPDKQQGALRLDSRGMMLLGGDSGAAIVPGKPEESLLLEAVRYESFEMPPSGQLGKENIEILEKWVKAGAFWPGDDGSIAKRAPAGQFTKEDLSWWAIQPLRKPSPPKIDHPDWAHNEIDFFVAARLKENGLSPAPEADRETLIRRLYFDVIGLPPTPQEVHQFVNDENPYAYEQLVDRLLERPEYGERWARHWLDLVRYADSDGYRADHYRPDAWRYRDYVIQSLNEDKPYDRFVQEQIAGDELFPDDPQAQIATGYLRHGIYEYNSRDVHTQWDIMQNEITDVTADVFMGLGLQCARCHDHKFDPLLQKDYFRLRAFFEPVMPHDDQVVATPEERSEYEKQYADYAEKTAEIRKELDALEDVYRKQGEIAAVKIFPDDIKAMIHKPENERSPKEQQLVALAWRQVIFNYNRIDSRMKGEKKERVLELRRQLAKFKRPQDLPTPMIVTDVGAEAPPTIIPKKGTLVEPGIPSILSPEPSEIVEVGVPNTTGRRATLAKWLTSPDNPLSTRVIVNRVWQYHFGKGLAENSSDFGRLGSPPTHPELLDWLTLRFLQEDWHLKSLHRLILNSSTYRQSSSHPQFARYEVIDPTNQWHWRASTRRLDAEQIRDAILMVTGRMDPKRGGPGDVPSKSRRSIYTRVMRNSRDPLLDVFDLPQFFTSTASRDTTTSPVQSLLLINSQTMLLHARELARHAKESSTSNDAELESQIRQLWRLALCREMSDHELQAAVQFVEQQAERIGAEAQPAALAELATGKLPYRDGQSILIHATGDKEWFRISHEDRMSLNDFTIEAFFQLGSIYESGGVRTLASKSPGKGDRTGWNFGITGKGSRRKPQTLVLQIFGKNAAGKIVEAALFSDQHVNINKPYFAAVSLQLATADKPGTATFYLKDLSDDDDPLMVAKVPHQIVGGIGNRQSLAIGSQRSQRGHFDGLIDEVRLSRGVLSRDKLLLTSEVISDATVGYWQFEPVPGVFQDSSSNHFHIQAVRGDLPNAQNPESAAFVDLCHVLLNSNEFLYVD